MSVTVHLFARYLTATARVEQVDPDIVLAFAELHDTRVSGPVRLDDHVVLHGSPADVLAKVAELHDAVEQTLAAGGHL